MKKEIKIFKALSNEINLRLLLRIIQKPTTTEKIKIGLTKMPLNRRLNILQDAGLIKRTITGNHRHTYLNEPTKFVLDIFRFAKDKPRCRGEE